MKSKHRHIMREQLDSTFAQLSNIKGLQPPVKGWLRSIREALGMSGKQFGERMGVSQPRVVRNQAYVVAKKRLSRTAHTMLLEDQQVSNEERQKMLESKIDDLAREMPNDFWTQK